MSCLSVFFRLRASSPGMPGLVGLLMLTLLLQLPSAARAEDSATLRKIRDTGVIVLGFRPESPPFAYLDAGLKPVGYSMDLCHRVVEAVKAHLSQPDLEVKLVVVNSATRLPMVANGSVDIECGITTNTLERQKTQAFSVTTFVAESRLLSKRSSAVRSLDELRGEPVASTMATTSIQYLHHANQTRQLDMKILVAQDDKEAFRMLQSGRALAYAMDDVLLRTLRAGSSQPADFVISQEAFSVEPYALGLPLGDAVFKQLVDSVLIGLYQRGEIDAIYDRWFQSPFPPKGINLKLPMSAAFKRVVQKPTDSADSQRYRD